MTYSLVEFFFNYLIGYNTYHIDSTVEKRTNKHFGVMGKERRWLNASLGVGVLFLLVHIYVAFALNDSGSSQDHNVVFLRDISGISDILRAKNGDNLVLVNRTDDKENNLSSTSTDTFDSDSSDVDPTDVPITTLNSDISRTTNIAENSDERPSSIVTTLITPGDGREELSLQEDTMDSTQQSTRPNEHKEDIVMLDTDVEEPFPTTEDINDVQINDFTIYTTEFGTMQEVSTVASEIADEHSFTTFSECEHSDNECDVSVEQYFVNSDLSFGLSTLNVDSELYAHKSKLEPSLSSPDIPRVKSEILEGTFVEPDLEESSTLIGPSMSVTVEPVAVTTKVEYSLENTSSTTKHDYENNYSNSLIQNLEGNEIITKSVTDTELSLNESSEYNDEYDLIVETLISTATVYYDEETLQDLETSRRVVRTVSQDFDADAWGASNQYRGFLSNNPAPVKTYMNVNSASAFEFRRKSQRKSDPEPDIDDIIKGIVQLLGGNVKVTAAEETDTRLTTYGSDPVFSSRINNRGPPRLTQVPPFGVLSSAILTRPPIRPPVTPPADNSDHHVPGLPPGRPQFVANTRPPFLAPLPPSLSSRPSPPIQKPYATGIPIPIDLLPEADVGSDGPPIIPLNPLFTEDKETDHETSRTDVTVLETSLNESVNSQTHSVEILHTSAKDSVNETEIIVTSKSSTTAKEELADVSKDLSSFIEVSTTSPSITMTEIQAINSTDSLVLEHTSAIISPTPVTDKEPLLTSSNISESVSSSEVLSSSVESPVSSSRLSSLATPPLQLPTAIHTTQHSSISHSYSPWPPTPSFSGPRPGVVLDDSNYRPGQIITGTVVPFETGPGDVFDVTVSAYQDFGGGVGPNAKPPSNPHLGQPLIVPVDPLGENNPLITTPAGNDNGFVSIDGRKTYFDLFPTATQSQGLTQDKTVGTGVGVVIPEDDGIVQGGHGGFYQVKPLEQPPSRRPVSIQPIASSPPTQTPTRPVRMPTYNRRPTQPPIRIDTCIVGDDSTCQEQLSEVCRTEEGVSSCYCKAGTARRRPRTPCKRVISLRVSVKVDRVGDQRIVWSGNYGNPESEEYRLLQWESHLAISKAMSKTRLSSAYLGNIIHKFYSLGGKVIVNSTIHLEDNPTTRNRNMPQMVQRQMIQVIQSHANNIGDSSLYVDGPLNPIPDVSDVNECNDPLLYDCHPDATCINEFGTFTCRCLPGYTDRYSDDPEQVGRKCESCSSDYCNKRGDCRIESGQKVCECLGSYYGTRCEIDGEVLGVAVGASVAAVVIIILTLIFLCMWSRRWKAQDRKTEVLARGAAAAGATIGGYSVNIQHKGGSLPPNQYGVSMEDRMRWAQIADSIGPNQNIYTQPGTLGGPTASPSVAAATPTSLFKGQRQMAGSSSGYASLGTLGSTATGQFSHEQFGLHHMNPVNPLATLQQQQHYQKHHQAFGTQSTYGQYGPASFTAMSQSGMGGISRAPTLGARTPVPLHDNMGIAATIGPMGGASVIAKGIGSSVIGGNSMAMIESSEEEMDRPYQLPRPKSRGSLAESSDIYYEPEDLTTTCGPPDRPPPPIPKNSNPQTYNFSFLH